MAKINLQLDSRLMSNKYCNILLVIHHKRTRATIKTGVTTLPEEWLNKTIVGKNAAVKNKVLSIRVAQLENYILQIQLDGRIRTMTAADIKEAFLHDIDGVDIKTNKNTFVARYLAFMEKKTKEHTRLIYKNNLDRMRDYDPELDRKTFDDINKSYLQEYILFLEKRGMKATSRSILFRCIKAVFNDAIDDEVTQCYPFRKITIKQVQTRDRSLTRDELRLLFSTPVAGWLQEYVDMFKLMFCLRGINIGDLALLDNIRSGRIEYDRQKTGKHYSIKVEPEAMAIIDKYRGKTHLLSILDRYSSYQDYTHHLNAGLKKVGMMWENGKKYTGTPLFPDITSYYARYTWASLAAELDIPRETIAAGLGHSWADVTAIYIRNDMRKKVDDANRKILDYVFRK